MEKSLSAENEILTELTQEFTSVREKRQKAEKEAGKIKALLGHYVIVDTNKVGP